MYLTVMIYMYVNSDYNRLTIKQDIMTAAGMTSLTDFGGPKLELLTELTLNT